MIKSNVPLSEVLSKALGFEFESTEKLTLPQAVDLTMKSGCDRKMAVIADLMERYGFDGRGLKIWDKFEDMHK